MLILDLLRVLTSPKAKYSYRVSICANQQHMCLLLCGVQGMTLEFTLKLVCRHWQIDRAPSHRLQHQVKCSFALRENYLKDNPAFRWHGGWECGGRCWHRDARKVHTHWFHQSTPTFANGAKSNKRHHSGWLTDNEQCTWPLINETKRSQSQEIHTRREQPFFAQLRDNYILHLIVDVCASCRLYRVYSCFRRATRWTPCTWSSTNGLESSPTIKR